MSRPIYGANCKLFQKVAVSISGGVDSAVAALLLKHRGYDVQGVFMKNWDEIDENGTCTGGNDWKDALHICKKIDIPIVQKNFVKEYWNNVFWRFLEDYQNGLTPNPDILCNKYIKFDSFFKFAMNYLKVDAIATGHYAQSSFGTYLDKYTQRADVKLLQAADNFKDQTFFLSNINQAVLRRTMFPVGNLLKNDVKKIAVEAGFSWIAHKRESTGICFIGQRKFKQFISEYIDSKYGYFVDIDTEQIVGTHSGIHQWTIGQRCRISGCAKPYFVAQKNVLSNVILVAAGTNHAALFTRYFETQKPHWISSTSKDKNFKCEIRFQHTKPLVKCEVQINSNGLKVVLENSLRAITPGQYAVFYLNYECLGCARIVNIGETESSKSCKKLNSEKMFRHA